jgi:hypothetical protein
VTQQQHAREILSLAGSLARAQWESPDEEQREADKLGLLDILGQIEARTQWIRNEMKEATHAVDHRMDSSGSSGLPVHADQQTAGTGTTAAAGDGRPAVPLPDMPVVVPGRAV